MKGPRLRVGLMLRNSNWAFFESGDELNMNVADPIDPFPFGCMVPKGD